MEQRDSIPVWSANPCLASQPSPWEAESPAQRHPFMTKQESLAGQGCHTLLPAPSFLAQFLWAGVPWEVLLHTQVCKKALKHVTLRSSQLLQPMKSKGRKPLESPFTDRQKEGRTGPTLMWIRLFSVPISLFTQLSSHIRPSPTLPAIQVSQGHVRSSPPQHSRWNPKQASLSAEPLPDLPGLSRGR